MKRRLIIPVVASVLVFALPARALVGVYAGGFGGVSSQKLSFDDVNFDADTTFLYGVRAGLQAAVFALEFNYYRAGHNVAMQDFFLFNWDGLENDTSFIGGNLRIMFPVAVFRPFLALGYGYYTAGREEHRQGHGSRLQFPERGSKSSSASWVSSKENTTSST